MDVSRWNPQGVVEEVDYEEPKNGAGTERDVVREMTLRSGERMKSKMAKMCINVYWLVVWNMNFMFHFIYGMSSFQLTNIFQDGWNHQPVYVGYWRWTYV